MCAGIRERTRGGEYALGGCYMHLLTLRTGRLELFPTDSWSTCNVLFGPRIECNGEGKQKPARQRCPRALLLGVGSISTVNGHREGEKRGVWGVGQGGGLSTLPFTRCGSSRGSVGRLWGTLDLSRCGRGCS